MNLANAEGWVVIVHPKDSAPEIVTWPMSQEDAIKDVWRRCGGFNPFRHQYSIVRVRVEVIEEEAST
jgi:hypothetical protein